MTDMKDSAIAGRLISHLFAKDTVISDKFANGRILAWARREKKDQHSKTEVAK